MTVYIYPHSGSVDDEGGQHRSNVIADDKVGNFVEFGRFAVDATTLGRMEKAAGCRQGQADTFHVQRARQDCDGERAPLPRVWRTIE